ARGDFALGELYPSRRRNQRLLTIDPADHEFIGASPVVADLRRESAMKVQLLQLADGAQVERILFAVGVRERPHRLRQQLLVKELATRLQVPCEFDRSQVRKRPVLVRMAA